MLDQRRGVGGVGELEEIRHRELSGDVAAPAAHREACPRRQRYVGAGGERAEDGFGGLSAQLRRIEPERVPFAAGQDLAVDDTSC